MSLTPLDNQRQIQSAMVLTNAAELTSGIIKQIAGNDISTSINGSTATNEVIQTIAMQRMVKTLEARLVAN